ncbi:unnamed protein product [Gordionus sp. m RMFG-2023]
MINTPVVILHGLFGSKRNWNNASLLLANKCKRNVYTLDLPNHGDSFHSLQPMNISEYASSIENFIINKNGLNLKKFILIGHSLGGKIAMELALNQIKDGIVDKLIVLDITPISKSQLSNEITNYFEVLESIHLDNYLKNNNIKKEIEDIMKTAGITDPGIRQFLLMNLYYNKNKSKYKWKFNISSLKHSIKGMDIVSNNSCLVKTLFIYGEKSNYVNITDFESIFKHFPNCQIQKLDNSGHWLHMDQPQALINIIDTFINSK